MKYTYKTHPQFFKKIHTKTGQIKFGQKSNNELKKDGLWKEYCQVNGIDYKKTSGLKEIKCEHCGKIFEAREHNVLFLNGYSGPVHAERKYCSVECKKKQQYLRAKKRREQKKLHEQRTKRKKTIEEHLESRVIKKWNNYADYCKSQAFESLKNAAFLRDYQKCKFCKGTAETIHHLEYVKWGTEKLNQVVSVCQDCHYQICHGDIALDNEYNAIMG